MQCPRRRLCFQYSANGALPAYTTAGDCTQKDVGPMSSQTNFIERRAHPRVGVMAQLEDITYSVLRKHGVVSDPGREASVPKPSTHCVKHQGDPRMANLTVISSNDQPIRHDEYPLTWLLHKDNDIIEIHVMHNRHALIDKIHVEQSGSVMHMRKTQTAVQI